MARNSVRGTPYTHVGPGGNSGIRPGMPKGMDNQTTHEQFRGTGMDTKQSARGTPYNSGAGNPADSKRAVSNDARGRIPDNTGTVHNDPAANGQGVVFDGADSYARGFSPHGEATMDSPVPGGAPRFDPGDIKTENLSHLGSGNASGVKSLVEGGGVMSRGMLGTSKPSHPESVLTEDDALPGIAPAGTV